MLLDDTDDVFHEDCVQNGMPIQSYFPPLLKKTDVAAATTTPPNQVATTRDLDGRRSGTPTSTTQDVTPSTSKRRDNDTPLGTEMGSTPSGRSSSGSTTADYFHISKPVKDPDEELLKLLPVLEALYYTGDLRNVLRLRAGIGSDVVIY